MMMTSFTTEESWEIRDIRTQLSHDGSRSYPFVEAFLHSRFFILDFVQEARDDVSDESHKFNRKFFTATTWNALMLIYSTTRQYSDIKGLTLLTSSMINGIPMYRVSKVDHIIHCSIQSGEKAYVVVLMDGSRYIDSLSTIEENELTLKAIVFEKNRLTKAGLALLTSY